MRKFSIVLILFFFLMEAKAQTIDFNFSSTDSFFCTPSTIIFKQLCTGNPRQFIWNFGNNNYGSNAVETQTYAQPGTYTVKLTAIFDSSTLSIVKTIVVQPAISGRISVNRNYICQPGVAVFSGAGSGGTIDTYQWDFKDGTPLLNTSQNNITHNFANYGSYPVSLKVTASTGCSAKSSTLLNVTRLPIESSASPTGGCVPALSRFFASATVPANTAIANYTWNFGDNTPLITTTGNNTSHTYTRVGEFPAAVTITSSEGCTNTFNFYPLAFGEPPTNQIAYAKKTTICGNETAVFVSTATKANRYFWDFGDGVYASTSDTTLSHKYDKVGNKTIRVTAFYNECLAVPLVLNVNVVGVIAKFDFANTCNYKSTFNFKDTSSGSVTNYLWSFGDNTADSFNVVNPIHKFPASGAFTTTLKIRDSISGCSDSISNVIYTAQPSLLNTDSSICLNSKVSFSINNNYTADSSTNKWYVVGQQLAATRSDTLTVTASILGNFNNYVIINNGKQSCPDTINLNRNILVRGPNLNVGSQPIICSNSILPLINYSTPFVATDTITSWLWDYGDAAIKKDSVFQPGQIRYSKAGNYLIKVTAIDKNGCSDILLRNVVVNPQPSLYILPKQSGLCYGKSDTLFAFHSDTVTWAQNNSISCTQCDTALINPTISTTYFATVTNSFNCSIKDSSTVTVSIPFTAAVSPQEIAICANDFANVQITPLGKKLVWEPTTGLSNSTSYNPNISPTQTTVYRITLSDSIGCLTNSSTVSLKVVVKSLPTVEAGPDKVIPHGTSFQIAPMYSSNITTYLWTPSVLLSCSDCAVPSGVNTYSQLYHIQVTSDSGCIARDSIRIAIDCKNSNILMPMAFTPNGDNLNDIYYPMSVGIKTVTKFIIFNRTGQVVFERNNFSPNDRYFGWDGRFKGTDQPMGSFVYTLQLVCDAGEKIVTKGSFVLIR